MLQAAGFKFELPGVQVGLDMTAVTLQVPAEALGLALWLDFLTQKGETWTRIRAILTDTDLYMLQATARTKEALLDDSVPRFLASFRRY